MNKNRLEALGDGVFSIVMTLLIIEIKVPHTEGAVTDQELWLKLGELWPLFRSYIISFFVLGMYWIAHHAFFHLFAKNVNRVIALLNILFLMFIAFIPFSAHLLGQYPRHMPAIIVYGVNIIFSGLILYSMLRVAIHDKEVLHETVSWRLILQATTRILLPPVFAAAGIAVFPFNRNLSFFLFVFPIIFNIIPGTLNILEGAFVNRVKKN